MFLAQLNCMGDDIDWIGACRTMGCIPTDVAKIVTLIYGILKIAAPLVLILVGMFDMAKAVAAGKEDEIKKAQQLLVKKAISAAIVFLLLSLVTFVLNILSKNDESAQGVVQCMDALLNASSQKTNNWRLHATCPHGEHEVYAFYATEEECNNACSRRITNQGCSCSCSEK